MLPGSTAWHRVISFIPGYTDTSWSAPIKVSTGPKVDGFYRPAIAESLTDGFILSGNVTAITMMGWGRYAVVGMSNTAIVR